MRKKNSNIAASSEDSKGTKSNNSSTFLLVRVFYKVFPWVSANTERADADSLITKKVKGQEIDVYTSDADSLKINDDESSQDASAALRPTIKESLQPNPDFDLSSSQSDDNSDDESPRFSPYKR